MTSDVKMIKLLKVLSYVHLKDRRMGELNDAVLHTANIYLISACGNKVEETLHIINADSNKHNRLGGILMTGDNSCLSITLLYLNESQNPANRGCKQKTCQLTQIQPYILRAGRYTEVTV